MRWKRRVDLKHVAQGALTVGLVVLALAAAMAQGGKRPSSWKPPPGRRQPRTKLPADLSLEVYCSALRDESGSDAVLLLVRGIEWTEKWRGWVEPGRRGGPHAPLYFMVPDRDGKRVRALDINTAGAVGVLFRYLRKHPPYDVESERRALANRLNRIHRIDVPYDRWNKRAYHVTLATLRDPAAEAEFFEIFDDVAQRLQAPSA